MYRSNDNWERLVAAVLRKDQLWQLFHEQSRSPSLRSEASSSSSSSFQYLDSPLHDLPSFSRSLPYQVQPKLVFLSDSSPVFDFKDLLYASTKLLGNGTFGSTYKADMDNGIAVVVKELKLVSMSEVDFKRHMELLQNIRHENIVELRAYFYRKEEKLILYDHYKHGSVSDLLYGGTGKNRAKLDWETRKRIALGAARGVAHIHTQRGAKLVHGNIKASNIFLDSQHYGCVSEFGLKNMILKTFLDTARYHAPEFENTQNVSQASDVYNFGVLLLELLMRKSSNQDFDIVMWVCSVKRKEWTTKIFDVDLLKNPAVQDQMVRMLQIGIRCVAKAPKKRPKMSAVMKTIANICRMHKRDWISIAVNKNYKLVFFDDFYHRFDLQELLGSSAEFVGKGTFGTTCKLALQDANIIALKRLEEVIVGQEEFEQQMNTIGNIRHENVAPLRAYYYSKDEKIMVFDYYNQGSVSALLHAKRGENRIPLDWEARLKIAMGAAKGIAHIHSQNGGKIVHGNIKSSNIFLNTNQYGCVCYVGLVTFEGSITPPGIWTAGYCAPEVMKHASKTSPASDVYSFGVVLLELLTGKFPLQASAGEAVIHIVRWVHTVVREKWTGEVFDVELLRYPNIEEEMVALLKIGMSCVARMPEQRPKIVDVVKMVEGIRKFQWR